MWKLVTPDGEHPFGPVFVEGLSVAGPSYRDEDVPAPRADGVWMGQDFADPGDLVLTVAVEAGGIPDPAERRKFVDDTSMAFSQMWDAVRVRSSPMQLAELWTEHGVFEGRPRMVEWDRADYAAGFLRGRARFVRSTAGHFLLSGGESWREVEVQIVPPEPRDGWEWPLEWPLLTLNPTVRASWFEAGGDTDTPVVLTVQGPLGAGAEIEVPGSFRARTVLALAHDQVAVLDARPGRMLQTINGVPSPFLTPDSSLLSGFVLSPGPHSLALRGVSSDGQARASLRWRDMKAGI